MISVDITKEKIKLALTGEEDTEQDQHILYYGHRLGHEGLEESQTSGI